MKPTCSAYETRARAGGKTAGKYHPLATEKEACDTGPIYFNARYYDPQVGRFLTEDPSRKGGNWYAYCENDPINKTDPTCMQSQWSYGIGDALQSMARVDFGREEFGYAYNAPNPLMAAGWTIAGTAKMALDIGKAAAVAAAIPAIATAAGMVAVGWGAKELYRAVQPAELADIQASQVFRSISPSSEGKYFTTSAVEASSYAKLAVRGFGDPPYTLAATTASRSVLKGLSSAQVEGGIKAWVIPNERLPELPPTVLNQMPIPPK